MQFPFMLAQALALLPTPPPPLTHHYMFQTILLHPLFHLSLLRLNASMTRFQDQLYSHGICYLGTTVHYKRGSSLITCCFQHRVILCKLQLNVYNRLRIVRETWFYNIIVMLALQRFSLYLNICNHAMLVYVQKFLIEEENDLQFYKETLNFLLLPSYK